MTATHARVYTIGHSTHSADAFVGLLGAHGITAVADVRSTPYSRRNPQFNRDRLQSTLHERGIAYVFLGAQLGARSEDSACYEHGKVQYDRLARTTLFRQGLERVRAGMKNFRVALMCAEKEPLQCHRTLLVARHLHEMGIDVRHILADGTLETHEQVLERLMRRLKSPQREMFQDRAQAIEEAYRVQGERIAYVDPKLADRGAG